LPFFTVQKHRIVSTARLSFSIKGGGCVQRKMRINHLKNGYSDYVFMFLKKYHKQLNRKMKVGDIGAGHLRNLKLFDDLKFKEIYALDREKTDNPLNVNLTKFILQDIENGIPFPDKFLDITLCNYVLMFINKSKQKYVIDELMRVTNKFLIIETHPKKYKVKTKTFHKEYKFKDIVKHIEKNPDFELLQVREFYEKITARRKEK
jgi:hypothetical protein